MKRSFLCLLTALFVLTLLAGWPPAQARADSYMDVNIYGFDWPTAGTDIAQNLAALHTPEGAPYEIISATYGIILPSLRRYTGIVSGTFAAEGRAYFLTVKVRIKGLGSCVGIRPRIYDRASGHEVTQIVFGSFTLSNTLAASISPSNPWEANISSAPTYIDMDPTTPPGIDYIALQGFDWPIAGTVASQNAPRVTLSGYAHYRITNRTWYAVASNGTETPFYNAFVDGQRYRLKITLEADDYYHFAAAAQATVIVDAVARNPYAIDGAHFPNAAFRSFVSSTYDTNGNGVLDWDEYRDVTSMNCANKNIGSLVGLQYFPNLLSLNASGNSFYSLDLSGNPKLFEVNLENNANLSNLNVTALSGLKILRISGCNFYTAPNLGLNAQLRNLYCANMSMTALDVSHNENLTLLDCSMNAITALDVTNNPNLATLRCNSNHLLTLDLSGNPALKNLECQHNGTDEDMFSLLDISACPLLVDCAVNGQYEQGQDVEGWYDLYTLSGARLKHSNFTTRLVIGGDPALMKVCFPDDIFRDYVKQHFDTDHNNRLSETEIAAATTLDITNAGVTDLTGLEYLTGLTTLKAADNGLSSVSLRGNELLEYIDLSGNNLTSIDTWYQTNLRTLLLSDNNISTHNFNNNRYLKTLYISNNSLGDLMLTYNRGLEELIAVNAGIRMAAFASSSQLYEVDLTDNSLTGLSISKCPRLQVIVGDGTCDTHPTYREYNGPEGGYLMVDIDVELTGTGLIPLDETYFPDANLREYLLQNAGEGWAYDKNGDYALSPSEILDITELEICGLGIEDYTGIEYFSQLRYLNVEDNPYEGELDITPFPCLDDLWISDTNITGVIYSGNYLESIHCANTAMASLDWLGDFYVDLSEIVLSGHRGPIDWSFLQRFKYETLETLDISNMGLTSLDEVIENLYDVTLYTLIVSQNPLGTLDLLDAYHIGGLSQLTADHCNLTEVRLYKYGMDYLRRLDLTSNPNLREVYVGSCEQLREIVLDGDMNSYSYGDYYTHGDNAYMRLPRGTRVVIFNEDDLNGLAEKVKLPDNIARIEDQAFEGMRISAVYLNAFEPRLAHIGHRAFADNPALKAVYIPPECAYIAEDAFEGSLNVTICGSYDSEAWRFAQAHDLPFAYMSLDP